MFACTRAGTNDFDDCESFSAEQSGITAYSTKYVSTAEWSIYQHGE